MFGARVGDKRYKYYVINKSFYGTIFGQAKDNNITTESREIGINNGNIEDFMSEKKAQIGRILFWMFYIVVCGFGIYVYVTYDNDYLED